MSVQELVEFAPLGTSWSTIKSLRDGEWVPAGLSAAALGVETTGLMTNPASSVLTMGFEWVVEHIQPLTSLLDEVAVDAAAATQRAESVRAAVAALRTDLATLEETTYEGWEGQAARAHSAARRTLASRLRETIEGLDAVAAAMETAALVVATVREFVRGLIADVLAGATIGAGAAALTGGVLGPGAVGAVTAHVSVSAGRAATKLGELAEALSKLERHLVVVTTCMLELRVLSTSPSSPEPYHSLSPAPDHESVERFRTFVDEQAPREAPSDWLRQAAERSEAARDAGLAHWTESQRRTPEGE